MSQMQMSKNELKHLLNPETGEWVAEYDPIFAMDDAYSYATTTATTLKTVATGKYLYAYALLVTNKGAAAATYTILEGATIKLQSYIISGDVHHITTGNPRAPLLKFQPQEPIYFRTGGATCTITMSYWECELE